MDAPSTDVAMVLAALAERDPETLVGPVMCLLTWLARDCATGRGSRLCPDGARACLVAHLGALAAHPVVALDLRLAAGSLAIEFRARPADEIERAA